MKRYRFKTKEEFQKEDLWNTDFELEHEGYPHSWNAHGRMNEYLGEEIPEKFNSAIESNIDFQMKGWVFTPNCIIEIVELNLEQTLEQINLINKSLITEKMNKVEKKPAKVKIIKAQESNIKNDFVFMDKTLSILEVGMITGKNVILFGPGE